MANLDIACAAQTSPALTAADLAPQGGEVRVEDRRLAAALGFTEPLTIRKLIRRHEVALWSFGEVFATGTKPGSVGRPGKTYWLNEEQALYITAKSDTPTAADVTVQMVRVFKAYQSGHLVAPRACTGSRPSAATTR